jgi:hypothetical protein
MMFMATMLASFVIYLCVSVSKLLPLFIFIVLAVALIEAAFAAPLGFAGIKEILQKRE